MIVNGLPFLQSAECILSRQKLRTQHSTFGTTASCLAVLDGRLLGTAADNNDCLLRAMVAGVCALSDPESTAAAIPFSGDNFHAGRRMFGQICMEALEGFQSHGQTGTIVRQVGFLAPFYSGLGGLSVSLCCFLWIHVLRHQIALPKTMKGTEVMV